MFSSFFGAQIFEDRGDILLPPVTARNHAVTPANAELPAPGHWSAVFGSLDTRIARFRERVAALPPSVKENPLVVELVTFSAASPAKANVKTFALSDHEVAARLEKLPDAEGLERYQAMLRELNRQVPKLLEFVDQLGLFGYASGQGVVPLNPKYAQVAPGSKLFLEMRKHDIRASYAREAGEIELLYPFSWRNSWASLAKSGLLSSDILDPLHEHVHWMDLGEGKDKSFSVPQVFIASAGISFLSRLVVDLLRTKFDVPALVSPVVFLGTSLLSASWMTSVLRRPVHARDRGLLSEVHAYELTFRHGAACSSEQRAYSTKRILGHSYGINSELREALLETIGSTGKDADHSLKYLQSRNTALQRAHQCMHELHLLGMPEQEISQLVAVAKHHRHGGFRKLEQALQVRKEMHGLSEPGVWEQVAPCLEELAALESALNRASAREIAQKHLEGASPATTECSTGTSISAATLRERVQYRFGVQLSLQTVDDLLKLAPRRGADIQAWVETQRAKLSPQIFNAFRRPSVAAELRELLDSKLPSAQLPGAQILVVDPNNLGPGTATYVAKLLEEFAAGRQKETGIHLWYPELVPQTMPSDVQTLMKYIPSRRILGQQYEFDWVQELNGEVLSAAAKLSLEDLCHAENDRGLAAYAALFGTSAEAENLAELEKSNAGIFAKKVRTVQGIVAHSPELKMPIYLLQLQCRFHERIATIALRHGDASGAISSAWKARCAQQLLESRRLFQLGNHILEVVANDPSAQHLVVLPTRAAIDSPAQFKLLNLDVQQLRAPASGHTWHRLQRDYPLDWLAHQGEPPDSEAREVLLRDLCLLALTESSIFQLRAHSEGLLLPIINCLYPEQLEGWLASVCSQRHADMPALSAFTLEFLRTHAPGEGQRIARSLEFSLQPTASPRRK